MNIFNNFIFHYKKIKKLTEDLNLEDDNNFLTKNFYRPLSYLLSTVFLRLKFSPNLITTISLIFIFVGLIFTISDKNYLIILGLISFVFYHILDQCDGNIARYKGKCSNIGDYLDTIVGYIYLLLHPLSYIILLASKYELSINKYTFLIIGACVFPILGRLFYQKSLKYKNNQDSVQEIFNVKNEIKSFKSKIYNFYVNIFGPQGFITFIAFIFALKLPFFLDLIYTSISFLETILLVFVSISIVKQIE